MGSSRFRFGVWFKSLLVIEKDNCSLSCFRIEGFSFRVWGCLEVESEQSEGSPLHCHGYPYTLSLLFARTRTCMAIMSLI